MEDRAFKLAGRLHDLTAQTVHALHVDATVLETGSPKHVDVKTKRLVTEPFESQRE
jgi:hypothetical protein